jgi:Ca2+-transporting ATPase
MANNARLSQYSAGTTARSRWIGQPANVALLDLLDSFGEVDVRDRVGSRIAETPLSPDREWMGVIIRPPPTSETRKASK